jgi:hypothetical protein
VTDLTRPVREELEKFFIATDELEDKKLSIIGWKGSKAAMRAIKEAAKAFTKEDKQTSREPHGPYLRARGFAVLRPAQEGKYDPLQARVLTKQTCRIPLAPRQVPGVYPRGRSAL